MKGVYPKVIACDYDGTLFDRDLPNVRAVNKVARQCIEKGIIFIIITGRNDTIFQHLCCDCIVIGSNGCKVSVVIDGKPHTVSSKPLSWDDINHIISVYHMMGVKPDRKGYDFFKSPVFIEETKVSVVLGHDQEKQVKELRKALPRFTVGWGALPFADISHKTNKKTALDKLLKELKIKREDVIVIADDGDNNKELLTYPNSYQVIDVSETYAIINNILKG